MTIDEPQGRAAAKIWGMDMASGNDIKAHTSTYSGFLGLVKWGIITTALITALVVFLIS